MLKEIIIQFIKLIPAFKVVFTFFIITLLSFMFVKKTDTAVSFTASLIMGASIKKTWFIFFIQWVVGSKDERVVKACGKKISDWLLAFSAAALVPFLILALTEESFLQSKHNAIQPAAFIVMTTVFASLRITKHLSEGLRRINTRDDLRDIIRSEFGDIKFKYDELSYNQVKQILQDYNIAPPPQAGLKEYLEPILQKHGLLPIQGERKSNSDKE